MKKVLEQIVGTGEAEAEPPCPPSEEFERSRAMMASQVPKEDSAAKESGRSAKGESKDETHRTERAASSRVAQKSSSSKESWEFLNRIEDDEGKNRREAYQRGANDRDEAEKSSSGTKAPTQEITSAKGEPTKKDEKRKQIMCIRFC